MAVIDAIEEENLLARGAELGDLLQARLNNIAKDVKTISEVRGLGAMVAVEFRDPATGNAATQLVKDIQNRALANKLILLTCGIEGNVIRFLFPLTITDAVMAEALDILEAAIRG